MADEHAQRTNLLRFVCFHDTPPERLWYDGKNLADSDGAAGLLRDTCLPTPVGPRCQSIDLLRLSSSTTGICEPHRQHLSCREPLQKGGQTRPITKINHRGTSR